MKTSTSLRTSEPLIYSYEERLAYIKAEKEAEKQQQDKMWETL